MKIGEIIQRVQTIYSKGVRSDDTRLFNRPIYNKLLSARMQLLAQQIKKKQKISDWNYAILPCVELIRVPSHECSCLGQIGCDIWRTKYPLPKILTDLNKHYIEYVMSIENGMKIEEITRQGVLHIKGNKYTSQRPKYILENGHLYFPLQKSPGLVKIKMLPEDPIKAQEYPSFCDDCEDCHNCTSYLDLEFYIDGDMIEPLIKLAIEEDVEFFTKGIEDVTNNSVETNAKN